MVLFVAYTEDINIFLKLQDQSEELLSLSLSNPFVVVGSVVAYAVPFGSMACRQ